VASREANASTRNKYLMYGTIPQIGNARHGVLPAEDFAAALRECRKMEAAIVHHDFIRLAHDASGVMDGLQRPGKARFLIVRRNDEGNHDEVGIISSRPGSNSGNAATERGMSHSAAGGGKRTGSG